MDSKKPVLIIDTCTDLPYSYIEKHNIPVINFTYHFQGREHIDDFFVSKDSKTFYDAVRSGEMPTTSQVNTDVYIEKFRPYLENRRSVIYLCFSSALWQLQQCHACQDMLWKNFRCGPYHNRQQISFHGEGLLAGMPSGCWMKVLPRMNWCNG